MSEHDQMEEFFRDRAENYEYPFNERDWEALEARLDREMPTRGGNFWGQVLAGILMISLPWWPWTQTQPALDSNSTSPNAIEQTSPSVTQASPKNTMGSQEIESVGNSESSDDFSTLELGTLEIQSTDKAPTSSSAPVTARSSSMVENTPLEEKEDIEYTTIDRLSFIPVEASSDRLSLWYYLNLSEYAERPSSDSSEDEEIIAEESKRDYQIFRPYILIGSEYAGTQMDNSPQLGYRAGIGLQMQPFKRLSLSVGLNYANIGYTAYSTEFYPAPDVYSALVNTQYESISWTDGTCVMWEIPVVLRYHPTSWLSIGTGLRSYIIDYQEYDLYVDSEYGPTTKNTVTYEENHSAPMAHWILNAGFQIPLGRDYLEIQPFYQIPLRGLGTGNVEWNSAGVSLRYLF